MVVINIRGQMKENMRKILPFFKKICLYLVPIFGVINLFQLNSYKYSSILCLFLIICLILLYKNINAKKFNASKKYIVILTILYSLFIVLGMNIDKNYENYFYSFRANLPLVLLEIYSIFIFVLPIVFNLICYVEKVAKSKNSFKSRKVNFIVVFIILLISWIPYLINYFPGLMSPDSINQWEQASGVRILSNHHPIAHTMFIKLFYEIGNTIGDVNIGVVCYCLAQMIILSLTFAYLISYLISNKCNKYLIILSVLFYVFMPVFGIYSVTMWKDVLFGAGATILIVQLHKFVVNDYYKISDKILLVISVIWTCLFRTNGLYAVLAVVLSFLLFLKKYRKKTIWLLIIPTFISMVVVGPVYSFLNIKKPAFTENVGIFTKQIYGVVAEKLEVKEEDLKFLDKLVNREDAVKIYSPYGDHIKSQKSYNNDFLEANKIDFFKTWISIGLKYPTKYIDIYLKSTYGYWYPEAQGYIVQQWSIADNDLQLKSSSNFNSLKLNEYFNWFYNFPCLKYLTSDAFCWWILIFSLTLVLINKKYKLIFPLLLPIFIWVTLMIATPLAYQPRYTFALYCMLPMIIFIGIQSFNKKGLKNEK